ncbi:MAG: PP-loop domain-containing protein [Proteobacteria bacterium]|nr:PP-loop domain-containing protein [Pseudomonadota bacterium]
MNRRVGRAMHDYAMLADGDRVAAAVSGGMDSLVLAWLLADWRRKAPIAYELTAVHIDMEPAADGGPGEAASRISGVIERIGLPLCILPARWRPDPATPAADPGGHDLCFQCARSRRTQLFAHARDHGCTTIALGHHRDDIIETFLLNLTCAGNISTMVPRQELFAGRLALIRPLAYLEKSEIETIGRRLGFAPIRSTCPLREQTRRRDIRLLADHIYQQIPGAKRHIFAALGNVRSHYLLRQTGGRRP